MFNIFKQYPEIVVGFSEKRDGNMKPPGVPTLNKISAKNREKFLKKHNITVDSFVGLNQVHGDQVEIVGERVKDNYISGRDGLLTREKGLFISIRTADCLPIFVYDYNRKVVGMMHAGWKGLKVNIIKNFFKIAQKELNLNPKTAIVFVGPSIGPCHFEVKADVEREFSKYPKSIIKRDNKIFINLRYIVIEQLLKEGVRDENIEVDETCTVESNNYFSFRRDKPKYTEAMMAVIGMKS